MAEVDLAKLSPSLFPEHEDDTFEFKSSLMGKDKFKEELDHAASAFANSGGGCIIWGVNDKTGQLDGGVEKKIGDQPIRDWIDKIIHLVSPPPRYSVELYDKPEGRGTIDSTKSIVAISIHPSTNVPHMANDKHYWIRAGAHTVKAGHFLVEALWAKRQVTTPQLSHAIRLLFEGGGEYVQLGILSLTPIPAINVSIRIDEVPEHCHANKIQFPLRVPSIDLDTPTYFKISANGQQYKLSNSFLKIAYEDAAGNKYKYEPNEPLSAVATLYRA